MTARTHGIHASVRKAAAEQYINGTDLADLADEYEVDARELRKAINAELRKPARGEYRGPLGLASCYPCPGVEMDVAA